ncbi:MAG: hypothetical protein WC365_09640 [Candidatus Babeliales bacterium]|jgi:hypothetical protein
MIQYKHIITCDICGKTIESHKISWCPKDEMMKPVLPNEWCIMTGYVICNEHKAEETLYVDGKEISRSRNFSQEETK